MIDVFATIFLLCYAKLVFTCLRVLSYRVTFQVTNTIIYETYNVKSDPTKGTLMIDLTVVTDETVRIVVTD